AQEATRDYVLHCEGEAGEAPLISVFGGKLTTYRRLAEAVLDKVALHAGEREGPWTASKPLPGGDFTPGEIITEIEKLLAAHGYVTADLAQRLVRSYGTCAHDILAGARSLADLGEHFGAGLHAREVDYLQRCEWAQSAEDILWRRTKLGLRFNETQRARLAAWLAGGGG
ncbi:MAG: glycerol-3-phosphate dehydrogenase, partial [Alphaproteobacteria bacterium]